MRESTSRPHKALTPLFIPSSSIGLGGGSIVRKDKATGRVHIGPESVGYKILSEALVFGGSTLTTTDVVVAAGGAPNVGDASAVASVDRELVAVAQAKMKTMLEGVIDAMKTSPGDVVVYLVGGGSIISPDTLKGVSAVKRFPFSDCANAVGACVAQVRTAPSAPVQVRAHSY